MWLHLKHFLLWRYNEDYDQAGRRSRMEDTRITPGQQIIFKVKILWLVWIGIWSFLSFIRSLFLHVSAGQNSQYGERRVSNFQQAVEVPEVQPAVHQEPDLVDQVEPCQDHHQGGLLASGGGGSGRQAGQNKQVSQQRYLARRIFLHIQNKSGKTGKNKNISINVDLQAAELYNSDVTFSEYFLKHNKRLGDMIRRVQNYWDLTQSFFYENYAKYKPYCGEEYLFVHCICPSYNKLRGCSCQHKLSSCIRTLAAALFSHMSDNLIHVTINMQLGHIYTWCTGDPSYSWSYKNLLQWHWSVLVGGMKDYISKVYDTEYQKPKNAYLFCLLPAKK